MLIDAAVLAKLQRLIPLAPLHQPHNIAGIEAAMNAFPSVPQVACFDTAFHRSQPFVSDTYALPRSYYDEGVRRYGFHGLSYEYIMRKLRSIAPQVAREDVVIAHLGNGASMCAVTNGRSIASTMGFTALDGLPMGTRCGQIDPGVLLYLCGERDERGSDFGSPLRRSPASRACPAFPRTCASSRPPTVRRRATRSPISSSASDANWPVWPRPSTASRASSLPPASASIPGACAKPCLRAWTGWASLIDDEANRASAQIISSRSSKTIVFVIPTDEERMIAEHTVATAGVANSNAGPLSA